MINIVITAPRGHMDKLIVASAANREDIRIVGGVGIPGRDYIGRDIGIVAGLGHEVGAPVYDDIEKIIEQCDLVVDFSTVELSMAVLDACLAHGKALICGTTGFSQEQTTALLAAGEKIPMMKAANTSYVVNVARKALGEIAARLGSKCTIEIIEMHSETKLDAPSGTAIELAEEMADHAPDKTMEDIRFHSIRAGNTPSTHRIVFGCMGEKLEISHDAYDWSCYAEGACDAVEFMAGKGPGLYTMEDVITQNETWSILRQKTDPVLQDIMECREVFWINPHAGRTMKEEYDPGIDIDEADARLRRFAPFIAKMFPEASDGIIESELKEIGAMKRQLIDCGTEGSGMDIPGRLFLKCDSHLPVSGSVKARGGIYEVLKLAEKIAVEKGGLTKEDDYAVLAEERYRELFAGYKIAVGSTGNLGLSIGIISATLGFQVTVHMSADARQWKKDMLRAKGVTVVEYPDDYEAAVAQGRKEAEADPLCHFVDDENSTDLFEGYAVAGKRLKAQLDEMGVTVDEKHRMYVYLPCGVGGAPGGVTWGIRKYFGNNAYCFFAEPTHAPCMTLGLATGKKNGISVKDAGIDGITEADGLAVGRPSRLVADIMETELAGCFTVDDSRLYPYLAMLKDSQEIFIEPSACAAFPGLMHISGAEEGIFPAPDENSIHIIWATGGNMVPEEEKDAYYRKGKEGLRP